MSLDLIENYANGQPIIYIVECLLSEDRDCIDSNLSSIESVQSFAFNGFDYSLSDDEAVRVRRYCKAHVAACDESGTDAALGDDREVRELFSI